MNAVMTSKLEELDYVVTREPLYRRGFATPTWADMEKVDQDVLLRGNKPIAFVSPDYKLIQNRDSIIPLVKRLEEKGWQIMDRADGLNGRKAIRTEKGGARAYVELWNPDMDVEIKTRRRIETLVPRVIAFNSHDKTTSLGLRVGDIQLICLNGLERVLGPSLNFRHHHSGNVMDSWKNSESVVETFLKNYEDTVRQWEEMDAKIPGPKNITEALKESLGERKAKKVEDSRATLPSSTAWEVFDIITNKLTYDFKGNDSSFLHKQRRAAKILMS